MRKKVFAALKKALKNAKTACIAIHIDPDGDAIGTALALAMLLEKKKISTFIYSQDGVPKIYRFLPGAEKIKNESPREKVFDLAFILDSSARCRAGNKIALSKLAPVLINIDHHPDNSCFANINYVERLSSVAELVYLLARGLKWKIDKRVAECLYVAMITDTGNFRYENTSRSTFLMAADLLRIGVSTHAITTRIYDTKSIPSIKIFALAMGHLQFSEDKKIAWTAVSEEMMERTGAKGEDLIGLVDCIRSVDGVEVAILFREDKERIKINFRSKYRVNVSDIARRLGGGGHVKAAGVIIDGSLDEVKDRVIRETEKYLQATKYLT
jgi:phosphoesterase RecJ-like protein